LGALRPHLGLPKHGLPYTAQSQATQAQAETCNVEREASHEE